MRQRHSKRASAPPAKDYSRVNTRFVRCANCNTRHALAKPLKDYVRVPRCRCCQRRHWWQDVFRERRKAAERRGQCYPGRCGCGAYHFPHRRGSGYCTYNHKLTVDMLAAREGIDIALNPTTNEA